MRRRGIAAAIVAVTLAVWGCSSTPTPPPGTAGVPAPTSPSPTGSSASPSPSSDASPSSPTVSPSPTASVVEPPSVRPDTIATIVTDGLRIRSRPGTDDESRILRPRVHRDQDVFVVAGPVSASGYRWWLVQPLGSVAAYPPGPLGWVAEAGLDGERWVEAGQFECPSRPRTYAAFEAMDPYVALACHPRTALRFEARLGRPEATCGVDPGFEIVPFAIICSHPDFIIANPLERGGDSLWMNIVFGPHLDTSGLDPGVDPASWLNVTVTGRYDHPAAASCHAVSTGESVPEFQPGEVVLLCRATFVVTRIEPIVP